MEKKPKEFNIVRAEEDLIMQIPECCREGWDTCPHVARKQRKEKTNVGL